MKLSTLTFASVIVIALIAMTMFSGSTPLASNLVAKEMSAKAQEKAERSDTSLADERIRNTLNKRVDLIYDAEPFGDVRAQLTKDLKVNIVVDLSAKAIDDNMEISANLADMRLADGLRTMLRVADATYTIRNGVLLIISIDAVGEPEFLVRQMIDVSELLELIEKSEPSRMVGDLVKEGSGGETKETEKGPRTEVTPEHLFIDTVTGVVSPESWESNGMGNCVAKCIGGVLVVRATEEVANEVRDFVKDLEFQLKNR